MPVSTPAEFQSGKYEKELSSTPCCVVDLKEDENCIEGGTIVINREFSEMLSKEELEAVLLHEVGHLVVGHQAERSGHRSLQNEAEADAYAVRCGAKPEHIISGIHKAVWFSVRLLSTDASLMDIDRYVNHLLNSQSELRARFAILRQMT